MIRELLAGYEQHFKEHDLRGLKQYRDEAAIFLRWFSSRSIPLIQLTPELIYEYLRFRESHYIKPTTVRRALYYLRNFLRFAHTRKIISDDLGKEVSCAWMDIPGGFHSYRGSLRKILKMPHYMAHYHLPLFAPFFEEHLTHLLKNGYTRSSVSGVLKPLRFFHQFLVKRRVKRLTDVTPILLESFLRSRTIHFHRRNKHAITPDFLSVTKSAVKRFLLYAFGRLGRHFYHPPRPSRSSVLPDSLLNDYLTFGTVHKGLSPETLHRYQRVLLMFRSFLGHRRICRLQDVTVPHLDSFAIDLSKRFTANALSGYVSVLRCFFRYLSLQGVISHDLASRIVSPCRFSADRRPKYISWRKVETLLQKIDRSTLVGKRNYAIVLLFTSYGLRVREVASLKIADIDFHNSSFLLRARKNGRNGQMPLMPSVKEALLSYLSVRPTHPPYDQLFLTTLAPVKPIKGKSVSNVLRTNLSRCLGPLPVRAGGYLIRHSFAKHLLDRGAKLSEIGAVLGHTRLNSTLVYTRIATEELREVADNYASLL